jgi:hypothetical protein
MFYECFWAAKVMVDIEGTRRVLAHLAKARAERAQSPPPALLVPVRVRDLERGLVRWEELLEPLGLPMTPPLRQQLEFDRAFEAGLWVGERFPDGAAHREVMAIGERVLAELKTVAPPPAFSTRRPAPSPDLSPIPPRPAPPRRSWWRRVLGA